MRPLEWDDCETSVEEDGTLPIALYYPGHIDLDEAERLGRTYWTEEFGDDFETTMCERPQHVYLRKVPQRDWMLHQELRRPGRGAKPVTVFRWLSPWQQQACQGKADVKCNGHATVGIPGARVIGMADNETLWLCGAHYKEFDARWRAACTAAVAARKAA